MKKYLVLILLPFYLSGCMFYPRVDHNQQAKCELVTKKLTIDRIDTVPVQTTARVGEPEELVGLLVGFAAFSAATAIVSGSIVITGNAINWLEQEGTCDDGVIKEAINDLSDSLLSIGGWFVKSKDEILDWININKDETKLKT